MMLTGNLTCNLLVNLLAACFDVSDPHTSLRMEVPVFIHNPKVLFSYFVQQTPSDPASRYLRHNEMQPIMHIAILQLTSHYHAFIAVT